jgi:M6 family metalloprotease-like protein
MSKAMAVPSTGTANVPVILVTFSDTNPTYAASAFNSLLFGDKTWSMRDYYSEVSYGKFTVSAGPGGITGWFRAAKTHDYYGANDTSGEDMWPGDLVYEAVAAADTSGFNFTPYDSDGNCYVDVVDIVHQGDGEEVKGNPSSNIWSKSWSLSGAQYSGHSHYGQYTTQSPCPAGGYIKVNSFVIEPELLRGGLTTMGVFAHEFGHALGLPDLYDTDDSSEGIGEWSLMATGSWCGPSKGGDVPCHLDAWSKYALGWVTPHQVVGTLSAQPVAQAEGAPDIYQLLSGSPRSGGEYFLVENRQQVGFDTYLPGRGLLVWHIDEARKTTDGTDNADECYPGGPSCATQHYRVALEQADAQWSLEKNINRGDGGDPFPGSSGNTAFTGSSTPSSLVYSGQDAGVRVTNISTPASTMTATLAICDGPGAFSLVAPENGAAVAGSTVTLQWSASPEAVAYDVYFGQTSSPPLLQTVSGTSLTVNVGSGMVYHWKVVAKNDCRQTSALATLSESWWFSVSNPPTGAIVVFSDAFESGFPNAWQVSVGSGAPSTKWGASTYRRAGGSYSAWCAGGGVAPQPPGQPYLANMATSMAYGPFSLADAAGAWMEFDLWKSTEANFDYVWWAISFDGQNYFGVKSSGTSRGWTHVVVDLDKLGESAATGRSQVWIEFYFSSDSAVQAEGAYIDNVVVKKSVAPSSCAFTASPTSQAFNSGGGTGQVNVTMTAGSACSWSAVSNVAWITITGGASGTGTGVVSYSVAANTGTSRSGTLAIAGQVLTVTQAAQTCNYSITPQSVSTPSAGGSGSVTITAPASCTWMASSNATWISITSGANGSGSGTLTYSAGANSTQSQRSGTLTIAGQTFSVTQDAHGCTYSLTPANASFPESGGTGSFTVTSPAGCQWSAAWQAAWISVTAGANGNGTGTVLYSVQANTGSARNGTITVAGQTFTINQSAEGPSYAYSYWLPVANHVSGLNQSQWRSDLGLLNTGSVTANVQLKFFGSSVVSSTTYVSPQAQSILTDIVDQLNASGSGPIEVLSDQPLKVTTRTYNLVSSGASCYPNGTQGQAYPVVASGDGLGAGQSAYLAGLTENASYRCNIGVVNTGTQSATVLVELFDGAGRNLASYTVSLASGQWVQPAQPFLNVAGQTAMDRGYARITAQTGSGVFAFASVIDNITNDPTPVTMQR